MRQYTHIYPTLSSEEEFLKQTESHRKNIGSAVLSGTAGQHFVLTLMTIHRDGPVPGVVSCFSPGSYFNCPVSISAESSGKRVLHEHDCFEFSYVLRGHMYQNVEGQRYLYPPGSCCLINRHTLHTEELTTDYQCIFFSVSADFVQSLLNYGNMLLFPEEQNSADNSVFRFLTGNIEEDHCNEKDFLDFVPRITETEQQRIVHHIFEQMIHALLEPHYGTTYLLRYLFLRLIGVLCSPEYYTVSHLSARHREDAFLFARIDQILQERKGRITNSELAELLNYDGSYLGRIVKKHTGKSLYRYSLTFTMSEAARLLRETDLTAAGIAAELRFSNRTHFYKLFEEYYGMTPGEYRRSIRRTVC